MDPGIASLIGNLGVVGILVWHLWYHTTHSYPRMMDKFADEVEKIRAAFSHEQVESRNYHEHQTNELRSMLIQSMQAMRTAVHDVRDTAQTAINASAVATEKREHDLREGRNP